MPSYSNNSGNIIEDSIGNFSGIFRDDSGNTYIVLSGYIDITDGKLVLNTNCNILISELSFTCTFYSGTTMNVNCIGTVLGTFTSIQPVAFSIYATGNITEDSYGNFTGSFTVKSIYLLDYSTDGVTYSHPTFAVLLGSIDTNIGGYIVLNTNCKLSIDSSVMFTCTYYSGITSNLSCFGSYTGTFTSDSPVASSIYTTGNISQDICGNFTGSFDTKYIYLLDSSINSTTTTDGVTYTLPTYTVYSGYIDVSNGDLILNTNCSISLSSGLFTCTYYNGTIINVTCSGSFGTVRSDSPVAWSTDVTGSITEDSSGNFTGSFTYNYIYLNDSSGNSLSITDGVTYTQPTYFISHGYLYPYFNGHDEDYYLFLDTYYINLMITADLSYNNSTIYCNGYKTTYIISEGPLVTECDLSSGSLDVKLLSKTTVLDSFTAIPGELDSSKIISGEYVDTSIKSIFTHLKNHVYINNIFNIIKYKLVAFFSAIYLEKEIVSNIEEYNLQVLSNEMSIDIFNKNVKDMEKQLAEQYPSIYFNLLKQISDSMEQNMNILK
jgi:hypothetical protein